MPDRKITPPSGYALDRPVASTSILPPEGYKLDAGASPASTSSPRPGADEGFYNNFVDSTGLPELGRVVGSVIRDPGKAAGTVLDAGRRLVAPGQPERMSDNPNPIISSVGRMVDNSKDAFQQGVDSYRKNGLTPETRRDFGRSIPIIGPAMAHAQERSDAGDTAGAVGTMLGTATGLFGPEVLRIAPRVSGRLLRGTGEAMQESGASRMDKFLNGGKKLPEGEYNAPGKEVLSSGPSTSVAVSRPSLTRKITSAKQSSAPAIDAAASTSPGRVQIPAIRKAVDSVIDPMKRTASGPLGNRGVVDRLGEVRDSFGPGLNLNGSVSAPGVLDLTRKMDANINWERGPDALSATARNAGRQIRGKVRSLLYDAAPETKAPSERYANLADAEDLSRDNQNVRDVRFNSVPRSLTDLVVGGTTGAVTHNPLAGAGAAALSHVAPMVWRQPLVQTGLSTGLFQGGHALKSVAPLFGAVSPAVSVIDKGGQFGRLAPALTPPPMFVSTPATASTGDDSYEGIFGRRKKQ